MIFKTLPYYWWIVKDSSTNTSSVYYCFDFRKSNVLEIGIVVAYSTLIYPVLKLKRGRFTENNILRSIKSQNLYLKDIMIGLTNFDEIVNFYTNKLNNLSLFDNNDLLLFGKDSLILDVFSIDRFKESIKSLIYSKYPEFDFDKAFFIVERLFSGLDNEK